MREDDQLKVSIETQVLLTRFLLGRDDVQNMSHVYERQVWISEVSEQKNKVHASLQAAIGRLSLCQFHALSDIF